MNIKIGTTNKQLSSLGGLVIFNNLMAKSKLNQYVEPYLPNSKIAKTRNSNKFQGLINGFLAGAECLEDMDQLTKDRGFEVNCEDTFTSKTYGNFLRSFTNKNCKDLAINLTPVSYNLRDHLFPSKKSITIDIDSTSNQQYGLKMEGVRKNYKGVSCLDTIKAFDEYGLQYWCDVRPGSTFTSNGAGEIIHQIFKKIPTKKSFYSIRRYARADSGYCNSEFFNACAAKDVGFVTAMRSNLYNRYLDKVKYWRNVKQKGRKSIRFYDCRACDLATFSYKKERNHQNLRVIIIRAKKPNEDGFLFKQDRYDYLAFMTNIGEHEMSNEKIVQFYRKRGNAENFIKELKYGFDLKHYPCQKLVANKAYGLIASYAYNLMRFLALKTSKGKVSFAKKMRNTFINLPSQIVRHAKEVVIRYSYNHYKEVRILLEYIQNIQFGFG